MWEHVTRNSKSLWEKYETKKEFFSWQSKRPESIIPVENKHDAVLCNSCHPSRLILGITNNFLCRDFLILQKFILRGSWD